MADTGKKTVLSVCATTSKRLPELVIKDGQLIFVQDKHRIAFDFGGKRKFYNQIEELTTEEERIALVAPVVGSYYFVIKTAVLWTFQDKWIQLTTPPEEVVFIGAQLPELGSVKTIYTNVVNKEISVWDNETQKYIVVADKTEEISEEEISSLFE